jgi:hypothetical protein
MNADRKEFKPLIDTDGTDLNGEFPKFQNHTSANARAEVFLFAAHKDRHSSLEKVQTTPLKRRGTEGRRSGGSQ